MLAAPPLSIQAPRRLLFISATAANVRQGSGTYVGISVLRTALEAQGCEVLLLAPAQAQGGLWPRLWFNLERGRRRVEGYDAVVGFDLDGLPRGAGVARVCAIKGVLAEEQAFERGAARASLRVQAALEGRRARRADRIVATSRYAAAAIERHYGAPPERIRVVPELIDLSTWQALLEAAAPQPKTRPRVLVVAHLYPRKDVATLLRALARMESAPELRLVGIGPELLRLRKLARELGVESRVRFLGHIRRAELASEYRSADVFCLPSRQEGFGIVLLEAMAAGLPIVAARAAAIPEVVSEGESAWLFPPGAEGELAARLDRLLADVAARQSLAAAGRRRVRRFDAPLVATEFLRAIIET